MGLQLTSTVVIFAHGGTLVSKNPLLFISFQSEMKFALDRNVYLPLKMAASENRNTTTYKKREKRVLSLSYSCCFSFPTKASKRLQLHPSYQLSNPPYMLAKKNTKQSSLNPVPTGETIMAAEGKATILRRQEIPRTGSCPVFWG